MDVSITSGSAQGLRNDPWMWTIDEVLTGFCRPSALWRDRPQSSPPNPDVLERLITTHDIDGPTLLGDVDKAVLKDEFGITSLGVRSAILRAIERLRNSSNGYIAHQAAIENRNRITARATEFSPLATPFTPVHSTPRTSIFPSIENGALSPPATVQQLPRVRPEPTLRQGEFIHDDGQRKRRKLNLPLAQDPESPHRRDVIDSYLGKQAARLDDIFYGDVTAADGGEDDVDSNDEIELKDTESIHPGERRFVKGRLQHYMQTSLHFDRNQGYLYPYPERLVKEGNGQSVTVFIASHNGEVSVTRKNALFLGSDHTSYDETTEQDTSWDYLAKWGKTPNDTVLPLYADSGSENDFGGSILDEIEQEETERNTVSSRYLSKQEVDEVIEDMLGSYATDWAAEKLPKFEYRLYQLWHRARSRSGVQLVQNTRLELEHHHARMAKLTEYITDQKWLNKKQVVKQCASLELTAASIEEKKWQLQVFAGSQPARSAPQQPRAPRHQRHPIDDDESGDLVDSSSDVDTLEDCADSPDDDVWEDAPTTLPDSAPGASPDASPHGPRKPSAFSEDSVLGVQVKTEPRPSALETFKTGEVVDLTASSPPSEDINGPEAMDTDYSAQPENASEQKIESWRWTTLLELTDRKRIIMKLLHETELSLRRRVESELYIFEFHRLRDDLKRTIDALTAERSSIVGVDTISARTETLFKLTRLWLCWNTGTIGPSSGAVDIDTLESARAMADFSSFWNFMKTITSVANESSSQSEEEEGQDEDTISPRKRRKNPVIKDRRAQDMRQHAHERRRVGEARELQFKLNTQSSGLAEAGNSVVVNTRKSEDEDLIYLNPHVARRIKPHQIKGLRFMWEEIVGSANDLRQGCLLAHTMGLGKTMQAIAVVFTISEASASGNANVVNAIPSCLHNPLILILCPAGLIGNWADELQQWLPPNTKHLKPIRSITAQTGGADRVKTIKAWHEHGGTLLLSYHMFTSFVKPNPTRDEEPPTAHKDNDEIRQCLLEGPTIVIADEAHKFKNKKSSIGTLMEKIKTKSRIALTGSPLANNLLDYYAMLDWISPGYLGSEEEFKAHYKEPIEAGFYLDSTEGEQRRSLKKLKALKADIDPKVDRADITVLQGDLTPKTEFVLMLPLTDLQKRAYSSFIEFVQGSQRAESNTINLLDWIKLLGALCNHPSVLQSRLEQRRKKERKLASKIGSTLAPGGVTDLISERMAMAGISSNAEPDLSVKVPVIMKILAECKRIDDRVLVFSHQLSMLDYLEHCIPNLLDGVSCIRLDGATDMSGRLDTVKAFNQGGADVFLISTRAGGLGLNIAGANRVIICDFDFNPSNEEQAVGRAYRIGQQKEVFVYHLVTGGCYEEKLHNVSVFKRQLSSRVVDSRNPTRAAEKVKEYLFLPRDVRQEPLDEFYNKDQVLDTLLASDAGKPIRRIKTAETMHTEKEEPLDDEEEKEVQAMIEADKLRRTDPKAWHLKNNHNRSNFKAPLVLQAPPSTAPTSMTPALQAQMKNTAMDFPTVRRLPASSQGFAFSSNSHLQQAFGGRQQPSWLSNASHSRVLEPLTRWGSNLATDVSKDENDYTGAGPGGRQVNVSEPMERHFDATADRQDVFGEANNINEASSDLRHSEADVQLEREMDGRGKTVADAIELDSDS